MNRFLLGMVAVAALALSLNAHAQLTSVDGGAAATDANGLMWANVLGSTFGESGPLSWSPTGGSGSAQAWVAGLDSSKYGGYSDWTLASGDATFASNTTTNQIGELFGKDCGNSFGSSTSLDVSGKSCGALSSVVNAQPMNSVFGGSLFLTRSPVVGCNSYPSCFWVYDTKTSSQRGWTGDSTYGQYSGAGYALAVRKVSAPEIDRNTALGALALLLGTLAVLRDGPRSKLVKRLTPFHST